MLRERGFIWRSWDGLFQAASSAIADVLDDGDLSRVDGESRTAWRVRLDSLAEHIIRAGFGGLGVALDKDFFRDRRG